MLFVFGAVGLFILYFLILSIFGRELSLDSIGTMGVLGIVGLLVIFFANGVNAALAMAYKTAISKGKISLTRFYSYALDRAPTMFGIMLIRELIWLLAVGPFIALFIYFFQDIEFVDIMLYVYAFFMTFIIHMLFTPAFILAGAFDATLFASLKQGFVFLRQKHVFFIALYILFAFVWLFNFLPFIQIATIFFIYPLIYTAMIMMIKNTIKISEDED